MDFIDSYSEKTGAGGMWQCSGRREPMPTAQSKEATHCFGGTLMKTARVPVLALASMALVAPLACLAAPSSVAARNCAQALASHLNARVAAVNEQPNFELPTAWGPHSDQYIPTARAANGTQSWPMVCTVDRDGRVLSLLRSAPVDTLPLINSASQ